MEPSQSLEVEITFDVGPETEVPDWTQVPLVVTVAEPEVRELDAVYYDTAEPATRFGAGKVGPMRAGI